MPAADRRVFDDPSWRAHFAEDFAEALRQGPSAAVHDLAAGRGPFALDLSRLSVDTVMLHGVEDVNAPIGIARWFTAQVRSSRLIEFPGSGHLFTLERPEVILDLTVR
jgi:pimeloyl-ACP methyl ester carboxylesterase